MADLTLPIVADAFGKMILIVVAVLCAVLSFEAERQEAPGADDEEMAPGSDVFHGGPSR